MTKAFEFYKNVSSLAGRVQQNLHRIHTFNYNDFTFEVAQYKIQVAGATLCWVAVVTFTNDLPSSQKQFELPTTGYAFATQWLTAVEAGYDAAS